MRRNESRALENFKEFVAKAARGELSYGLDGVYKIDPETIYYWLTGSKILTETDRKITVSFAPDSVEPVFPKVCTCYFTLRLPSYTDYLEMENACVTAVGSFLKCGFTTS